MFHVEILSDGMISPQNAGNQGKSLVSILSVDLSCLAITVIELTHSIKVPDGVSLEWIRPFSARRNAAVSEIDSTLAVCPILKWAI